MAINPHHTVSEIGGVRCSIIATGVTMERAAFIESILKANGLSCTKETDAAGLTTIGVNNALWFNLSHALYSRWLKKPDGSVVTPYYWQNGQDKEGFYWER